MITQIHSYIAKISSRNSIMVANSWICVIIRMYYHLQILQLATGILTISQATASNGRRCTELLPIFLSEDQNNEVYSH